MCYYLLLLLLLPAPLGPITATREESESEAVALYNDGLEAPS